MTETVTTNKLRSLIEWLEAHEEAAELDPALRYTPRNKFAKVELTWYLTYRDMTLDDQNALAARIRHLVGGEWRESAVGDQLWSTCESTIFLFNVVRGDDA